MARATAHGRCRRHEHRAASPPATPPSGPCRPPGSRGRRPPAPQHPHFRRIAKNVNGGVRRRCSGSKGRANAGYLRRAPCSGRPRLEPCQRRCQPRVARGGRRAAATRRLRRAGLAEEVLRTSCARRSGGRPPAAAGPPNRLSSSARASASRGFTPLPRHERAAVEGEELAEVAARLVLDQLGLGLAAGVVARGCRGAGSSCSSAGRDGSPRTRCRAGSARRRAPRCRTPGTGA